MTIGPEIWMRNLIRIQKELKDNHKYELDDDDLVLHVVNNVRFEYDASIDKYHTKNNNRDTVDVTKLMETMRYTSELYWKRKDKDLLKMAKLLSTTAFF